MSGEFCLTFESINNSSEILSKLFEQQKSNRFCDITLYLNDRSVKLHRNILACNSLYFDSILKQNKVVKEQLTINNLENDTFDTFLMYCYTGKIEIRVSNVECLLKLANNFLVPKITEYCSEFLDKYVNYDNCLDIFALSKKFDLKLINLDTILTAQVKEITNGAAILNLSQENLINFVKYSILNIPLITSLEIFTNWVCKDIKNREKDFPKLLNSIQLVSLDHNDVSKHIESTYLYAESDKCFYDILNALIQNNILLPNYKNRYEELHYKFNQVNMQPI